MLFTYIDLDKRPHEINNVEFYQIFMNEKKIYLVKRNTSQTVVLDSKKILSFSIFENDRKY